MRLKLFINYIKLDQILPISPISVNASFILDWFLSLIPHFQSNSKFCYIYLQTIFKTWELHTTSTASNQGQATISLTWTAAVVSNLSFCFYLCPIQFLVQVTARRTLLKYVMLYFPLHKPSKRLFILLRVKKSSLQWP